MTTEGFEPTFSHPITIICLEGKLVYVAICSFTQTRTENKGLGNSYFIQLNYEAKCGLHEIRTHTTTFVELCANPLHQETISWERWNRTTTSGKDPSKLPLS